MKPLFSVVIALVFNVVAVIPINAQCGSEEITLWAEVTSYYPEGARILKISLKDNKTFSAIRGNASNPRDINRALEEVKTLDGRKLVDGGLTVGKADFEFSLAKGIHLWEAGEALSGILTEHLFLCGKGIVKWEGALDPKELRKPPKDRKKGLKTRTKPTKEGAARNASAFGLCSIIAYFEENVKIWLVFANFDLTRFP